MTPAPRSTTIKANIILLRGYPLVSIKYYRQTKKKVSTRIPLIIVDRMITLEKRKDISENPQTTSSWLKNQEAITNDSAWKLKGSALCSKSSSRIYAFRRKSYCQLFVLSTLPTLHRDSLRTYLPKIPPVIKRCNLLS